MNNFEDREYFDEAEGLSLPDQIKEKFVALSFEVQVFRPSNSDNKIIKVEPSEITDFTCDCNCTRNWKGVCQKCRETVLPEERVFALTCIPEGTDFGPYLGIKAVDTKSGRAWQLTDQQALLRNDEKRLEYNWMKWVRYARNDHDHNLIACQYGGCLYYRTERQIAAGEELIVCYGQELLRHYMTISNVDKVYYYRPVSLERMHDIFACLGCCVGYGSKEDLTHHMTKYPHYKNFQDLKDLAICLECGVFCYDDDAFVDHEKNCSQIRVISRNSCTDKELCKRRQFGSTLGSRNHPETFIDLHSKKEPIKRDSCGRNVKTRTSGSSRQHIRTHTCKKPFKCDDCGKTFTRAPDLKRHIRIHTGEKPFKCDHCEMAFIYSTSLKSHVCIHIGVKPFKCDRCEMAFTDSSSLKYHIRNHTGEKPFKCDHCELAFSQSSALKSHIRIHTGEKPFKCDHCEMAFSQTGALKNHIRIHTGEKPFKCDHCEMTFSQSGTLKNHIRTHTGEKPFKCAHCNMTFSQTGALKNHIRIHTGEKPFKCDHCDMTFSQTGTLKNHIRIHTGENPFKCDVCEMTFPQSSSLKQHICTHTSNIAE